MRNVTSLLPFDQLKRRACGGYCDKQCLESGFPFRIIKQLQMCLDRRDFTNPDERPDSDPLLEVSLFHDVIVIV